jgi:hypothetical protein
VVPVVVVSMMVVPVVVVPVVVVLAGIILVVEHSTLEDFSDPHVLPFPFLLLGIVRRRAPLR